MDLSQEIRALSWKQPYASLMLHGKIETRSWSTNYRGLVLICASKTEYGESHLMTLAGEVGCQRILVYLFQNGIKEPKGMAIAIGRLVACRKMKVEDEEMAFVKYRPELFCHFYEDVKPIQPFPWKGSQGWRKLTDDQKKQIILL